ncbi:MAG: DUF1573 domain-containing protein [Bacteroidaceae bacterium]|nr:DUF1573 domain-containing protein [Bacteroidaceae bacterium]
MKQSRQLFLLSSLPLLASCGNLAGDIRVSSFSADVGHVNVSDTAWARYRIRNVGSDTITLDLLPECDCTVVRPEHMVLLPGQRVIATVGYAPEGNGEFHKYVFVEQSGSDTFFTLEIKGAVVCKNN